MCFTHIVNIQIRPSAMWQRKIDEDHLIKNFIGSYTSSQPLCCFPKMSFVTRKQEKGQVDHRHEIVYFTGLKLNPHP